MKNTLADLNNHLFAELERITDENLTEDQVKAEAERSRAVIGIAREIIDNGRLALAAAKTATEYGLVSSNQKAALPEFLEAKK